MWKLFSIILSGFSLLVGVNSEVVASPTAGTLPVIIPMTTRSSLTILTLKTMRHVRSLTPRITIFLDNFITISFLCLKSR